MLYYFCKSHDHDNAMSLDLLRTFGTQLLATNQDLCHYVLENFANNGQLPTPRNLRVVIGKLMGLISSARIVLDGLDEWHEKEYNLIIDDITKISKECAGTCKILIASRKIRAISMNIAKWATISLEDNADHMQQAIALFVKRPLATLRLTFDDSLIDELEGKILEKAKGTHKLTASPVVIRCKAEASL